jgi:hypothetical protein
MAVDMEVLDMEEGVTAIDANHNKFSNKRCSSFCF